MRAQVRQMMGGAAKVRALRLSGGRTARDHIAALCDEGSFAEIGTFAGMRAEGPTTTAGDGRICGHGRVAGRPIALIADDVTVKRASSTSLNARKTERLVHQARLAGEPIIYFGEAGGARLPDVLSGDVFASEPIYPWLFGPQRPPLISVIVGQSYGGSSFIAAKSDIVVMLEGSVMALTSPRVLAIATGESIDDEALGGAQTAARKTGLVDLVAKDLDELNGLLRTIIELISGRQRPFRRRLPKTCGTWCPNEKARPTTWDPLSKRWWTRAPSLNLVTSAVLPCSPGSVALKAGP